MQAASANPRSAAARLAFFYAAFFTFIGINMPFWPIWLKDHGMSAGEIGALLAVGISAKVVGNPLVAHLADRMGERRRLMTGVMGAALVAFFCFSLVEGFWPYLAVTTAFYLFWAAAMPLGESLTMLAANEHSLDYGRIRLWGSIAFIAAVMISGRILVDYPSSVIFWLLLGAIAATLASCVALPDFRPPPHTVEGRPLLKVLGDGRFMLFVAAATLIQSSHGVYYAFGTLNWQASGYAEDLIGVLWAEGVIAEIVLFAFGARVLARIGPTRLILLGAIAASVRWFVTGWTDALPVLFVVQALHAFSFGATHLGAIHFIARTVPPSLSATAQSVYAALVMGLGLGLSIYVAGLLFTRFGGGAYFAMAAMGLVGLVLAIALDKRAKTA